METLKLLIADGTEEFRLALTEQVRGIYQIRTCQEGHETLCMLHSFKPDVLVLDMMLPGLDGITLLQRAAEAGLRPMVLATTRLLNDYVIDSVSRLGVGYLMVKPCDVNATVARLQDLTERLKPPAVSRPDPRTAVSNMLLTLGIPTKLDGYGYLREAILVAMRRQGQMVTKEIYPAVGKTCNASATQVERSIRSAIKRAWERRDESVWRMYFQTGSDGMLERPTNAEFISQLADRMAMGMHSQQK